MIPALIAVAILAIAVREPKHQSAVKPKARWPRPSEVARLPRRYWWVLGVAAALALGRFGEAFLVLKVLASGAPVSVAPGALVVMNIAYAAAAYRKRPFSCV